MPASEQAQSTMTTSPSTLCKALDDLIADVTSAADVQMAAWDGMIERKSFTQSARNLACYLAIRRLDLRKLQRPLIALGVSSLGRLEGRVLPTLVAVRAALGALARSGTEPTKDKAGTADPCFFDGEARLAANALELFGIPSRPDGVSLLVTCPSEAADAPEFMAMMVEKRVEAIRINCAHDNQKAWRRMIDHLRAAETASSRRVRVFMDLAGPKIRTGAIDRRNKHKRAHIGHTIALTAVGELSKIHDTPHNRFGLECTLSQALTGSKVGNRIFIDDGRLEARIDRVEPWGLVAEVVVSPEKGLHLRPEKGLNFPDGQFQVVALTDKDRKDLAFVSTHADAIEYSFVQSAGDVVLLQEALAKLRPIDWMTQSLVLKIETARAVHNLPEIVVQAAGRQPTAVMIARGDLAVEIGFSRTAEIQEEILWLGEAADIPVIWATQVLDELITTGESSRGEMTDAAMAARAECVMLNKGHFLGEGIDQLRTLLSRMVDHQHKKTPQLRALKSWGAPIPPSAPQL